MKSPFEIILTNHTTVESLSAEFNQAFPFLKLGFFRVPHKKGETSALKTMYHHNEKIFTISKVHGARHIIFNKGMKVFELEEFFEREYGLNVQVFRKSGSVWLETSATDDWTLEDENEAGKSMQATISEKGENFEDLDVE